MKNRHTRTSILRNRSAAILLLTLSVVAALQAQTPTPTCAVESSFQFPLWNDGVGWNRPANYQNITLADIDGDGQDELLGYGPFGVEVWHWEQNGQAWMKMAAGAPVFGPNDSLMAADVNGDGQAEMIQLTPSGQGGYGINVWQYNAAAQVWTILPQLQLQLAASTNLNAAQNGIIFSTPMIQFVDLNNTGRKELVYLRTNTTGGGGIPYASYANVSVFEVNSAGTQWSFVGGGPNSLLAAPLVNTTFQVGDVNGDGLPDLVLGQGAYFNVFLQQRVSASIGFAANDRVSTPGQSLMEPTFALGDVLGNGTSEIIASPAGPPGVSQQSQFGVQAYLYSPHSVLQPQSANVLAAGSYQSPGVYSSLRMAQIGTSPLNPKAATMFLITSGGVQEYAYQTKSPYWVPISTTPFINLNRYGDDVSHYTSLQFGKVNSPSGTPQIILIARDASELHTLVRYSYVCQPATGTYSAGFDLPQLPASTQFTNGNGYLPAFINGQAVAYGYISNEVVPGGQGGVRGAYGNGYQNLVSLALKVETLSYLTTTPKPFFSLADFQAVQTQLYQELTDAQNVVGYFEGQGQTDSPSVANSITTLYNQENSFLANRLIPALNLPTDVANTQNAGYLAAQVLTQIVGSIFGGLGIGNEDHGALTTDGANAAALAVSIVSDIVSDVQSGVSLNAGGGVGAGQLSIANALQNQLNMATTQNTTNEAAALNNWDVMETLAGAINDGSLNITAAQAAAAITAAYKQFELTTWQQLAPSAWVINVTGSLYPGLPTDLSSDAWAISLPSVTANYAYWIFYPALPSSPHSDFLPVSSSAMELLTCTNATGDTLSQCLGADIYDIIGLRNGWEGLSYSLSGLTFDTGNIAGVPSNPNPPSTSPITIATKPPGPPASLTISAGGTIVGTYTCNNSYPTLFEQSTPVNSVFPEPVAFTVTDTNGVPIPNATIQLSAPGTFPSTINAVTNSSGLATVNLVANGVVRASYQLTAQIVSPAVDPTAPACSTAAHLQLENTPGPNGGNGPGGISATVRITNKSGPANARVWTLQIVDQTGTASAMTVNSVTLLQTGGPACTTPPVVQTPFPAVMTGTDPNFTGSLTTDFSGCGSGLAQFTATISASATVVLSDGVSYPVAIVTTLPKFFP